MKTKSNFLPGSSAGVNGGFHRHLNKFALALLLSSVEVARADLWCVGYYPGWEQNSTMPATALDFSVLTHVVHFSVLPNADGSLNSAQHGISPANTSNLVAAAHAANRQVLISVGGAGSSFQSATGGQYLGNFVRNLTNFMAVGGYDGIDVDWEPLDAGDRTQFTNLVTRLRAALDAFTPRRLLTVAVPPSTPVSVIASVRAHFDQINLMTYDLSGPYQGWVTWFNSPIFNGGYNFPSTGAPVPSVDEITSRFINGGVPAGKIGIGLPFYGYLWRGGEGTPSGGAALPRQSWTTAPTREYASYNAIMALNHPASFFRYDTNAEAAYITVDNPGSADDRFISYDDERACQAKVAYARDRGLGGVMIWQIAQDHQPGQTGSLLAAVKEALAPEVSTPAPTPAYPFPRHLLYSSGAIRPNHRTPAQLDDDVRAFYDYWKSQYVETAGTTSDGRTRYRVSVGSENPARTVSEGQGYGMIIVPLMAGHDMNAHRLFAGLYEFAVAYPSAIDARLMTWEVPITPGQSTSAFDGDADIAYGLMLAHAQWGSTGRVDYASAARSRLAGILASTIGPQSRLPMMGDWVPADGSPHNQYTPRSSDFMPSHFRAWARFTGDSVWDTVAANGASLVTALQTGFSPVTGLLPDFIVDSDSSPRPAPAGFLEGDNDGAYYYNAGRDPWRLAVDALLNGEAASAAQARKISAWLKTKSEGNPENIRAGYQLDGSDVSGNDYFTSFFTAPVGVAAMLEATDQSWLNALYDSVRAQHEDYYEDSVTLLCLLALSGNFWDPTTIDEQPRRLAPLALPPDGRLHALVSNNVPGVTFNVSAQAAHLAFAVERSTNLSTWTLLAHRTNGTSFQAVASGVTVAETNQAQFTAVRVHDGEALNSLARFYRVKLTP